VFTGLRDDPFVLDGQFFRITAGLQDVFRDIPTSPLGPLRGCPIRPDGTSGVDMFGGFNASYMAVEFPLACFPAAGIRGLGCYILARTS
jgi:hypothetical protein